MITTLWQQCQIELDEAYDQYEVAIREAECVRDAETDSRGRQTIIEGIWQ